MEYPKLGQLLDRLRGGVDSELREFGQFVEQEVMKVGLQWLHEAHGIKHRLANIEATLQRIENKEEAITMDLTTVKSSIDGLANDVNDNFDAVKALVQKALDVNPADDAAKQAILDELSAIDSNVKAATQAAKDAVTPPSPTVAPATDANGNPI